MEEPLRGHRDCVNCLTIDGKFLYSGDSEGVVLEWDLSRMAFAPSSPEPVRQLADCESSVSAMTVIAIKKKTCEKRYLCTASYDKLVRADLVGSEAPVLNSRCGRSACGISRMAPACGSSVATPPRFPPCAPGPASAL